MNADKVVIHHVKSEQCLSLDWADGIQRRVGYGFPGRRPFLPSLSFATNNSSKIDAPTISDQRRSASLRLLSVKRQLAIRPLSARPHLPCSTADQQPAAIANERRCNSGIPQKLRRCPPVAFLLCLISYGHRKSAAKSPSPRSSNRARTKPRSLEDSTRLVAG